MYVETKVERKWDRREVTWGAVQMSDCYVQEVSQVRINADDLNEDCKWSERGVADQRWPDQGEYEKCVRERWSGGNKINMRRISAGERVLSRSITNENQCGWELQIRDDQFRTTMKSVFVNGSVTVEMCYLTSNMVLKRSDRITYGTIGRIKSINIMFGRILKTSTFGPSGLALTSDYSCST